MNISLHPYCYQPSHTAIILWLLSETSIFLLLLVFYIFLWDSQCEIIPCVCLEAFKNLISEYWAPQGPTSSAFCLFTGLLVELLSSLLHYLLAFLLFLSQEKAVLTSGSLAVAIYFTQSTLLQETSTNVFLLLFRTLLLQGISGHAV